MDVAALSLSIDSSSVVKAANDLDRFAAASARAGVAAGKAEASSKLGGTAKMAQDYARAADKADQFANSASRAASAAQSAAKASSAASSSIIDFGRGIDLLTGKVNTNFTAINRNIAAWGKHKDAVNDNAGSIKANTGNIAAQFQDIGVTSAMGMSPLLIALQQGTQLSAVFAQSGGSALATVKAAFVSILNPTALLTIALVAGAAALIQWAMSAFSASRDADKLSKAIEDTKITTYAFSDAQSALGGVIDLTTGKVKSQSEALRGLARAQLEMIRVTAIRDQAEARKAISTLRGRNTPTMSGGPGAIGASPFSGVGLSGRTSASDQQRLLDQFSTGKLTSTQAIDGMEKLRKAGKLTEDQFIKLTGAVASFGVAGENLKVYADARKALNGDKGALEQFLDRPKAPKGGKSDAEKLVDIYASAQADIATEKARGLAEANSLGAEEAARLEKQTALLNAIQQKGIPITDGVRAKVAALADEYAKYKVAADVSKVLTDTTDDIERQITAVEEQSKLTGLYGDALARVTREMEAQRKLRDALPKGEIVVAPNLTGKLSDKIEANARDERTARIAKDAADAAYAMDLERQGLDLTGEAAIAYAYAAERLNAARRAGTDLSPAEVASIKAAGAAYAEQRHAIDQHAEAIASAREVTKGFFSDWISGVREGANAAKAFADAAVGALNRIIDKLLDKALDGFLDSMFKNGPGYLSNLFGGGSSPVKNALGAVYGTPQRFANGGAFTNSVVNTPTLFRFANGGALGEMGEAGPEAIMPLKRGPNGALGVQATGGGKPSIRMGDVNITNSFAGAVGLDGIMSMASQASEAAYNQMKRDLQTLLAQLDADGTFAS